MLKLVVIIGTRPEAIKMAPIIKELKKYPDKIKFSVCITAQHREMLDQVLKLFNIVPDYDLNIMTAGQTLSKVTSKALLRMEKVLIEEEPNLVLIQGDTTTTFAASLIAFYHRIKIGHVEAGLRTHNKYHPYPEEINRSLVTVLADLHFAPSRMAQRNLINEGVKKEKIYLTGNTIIDALLGIVRKDYVFKEKQLQHIQLSKGKIILVTAHRRENFGEPLKNICLALKELVTLYPDNKIIYPVHPNPKVKNTVHSILNDIPNIILTKPLDYETFVSLMNKSYLILTDSGGIQEEAPSLGKPVLILRQVTERPEVVASGAAKIVGTNRDRIIQATRQLLDNKEVYDKMANVVNPYGNGKAAKRIVRILLSGYKLNLN